ncbi:MAG: hypothetical protein HOP10_06815 [Chitinophagaceae bacterium]|nr:hypothetical protein [Chitinophagaceae bacterium]
MKTPLNIQKYKAQTATVRPWAEIEQNYISLKNTDWQIDPLLQLVRHIIETNLCNRLFAFTSHDKLVVGIYDPMEWNREALHIEFDGQTQKWFFKYYPKPNEPIEFERKYTADKGIEKFDKFIKMMKW